MKEIPKNIASLYKIIVIVNIFFVIVTNILGAVLVYLGATGDSEIDLFGQNVKTANVGVIVIFISAVSVVVIIRSVLVLLKEISKNKLPSANSPQLNSEADKQKVLGKALIPFQKIKYILLAVSKPKSQSNISNLLAYKVIDNLSKQIMVKI